jgi:FlaG/FlaF family flagellin (archaellin)
METHGALPESDRGVSNVIGVILVVSITVLLASVAAVTVLDIGTSVENPPDNVRFATTYDDTHAGNGETITIEHRAGDDLEAAKVALRVDDARTTDSPPTDVELTSDFATLVGSDDILRAGESITLDKTDFQQAGGGAVSPYLDLGDAEVRLIWRSNEEATSSSTIYACSVEFPNCENRD